MTPIITLHQRAKQFNAKFPQILPLVVAENAGKPFLYGYWFLGGGKVTNFYGAYSNEYLRRVTTLFSGFKKVLHLFSGSLPPSPDYVRFGNDPTGQYKSDILGDAEQLSSVLNFHPDLIFADPPYTQEEAEEKYQISLCNGPKVVSECARVLQPGGYLIWLDTRLPVFSNDEIKHVGCISYIRSTSNRFRAICIFQKPY